MAQAIGRRERLAECSGDIAGVDPAFRNARRCECVQREGAFDPDGTGAAPVFSLRVRAGRIVPPVEIQHAPKYHEPDDLRTTMTIEFISPCFTTV